MERYKYETEAQVVEQALWMRCNGDKNDPVYRDCLKIHDALRNAPADAETGMIRARYSEHGVEIY